MSGEKNGAEQQGNQVKNPAPKSHAQIMESYMGPYPVHLDKKPVVTQELKDFAYRLPTILEQQAGINIYVPADAARLKSAYEVPDPKNPGKMKIIERDMLTSFNFSRNPDGIRDFSANRDRSEPLETKESVAEEVEACDFDYESSLAELEKENPNADKVHQFYMLMAAAQSGHLSVIRRDMREYRPQSVYLHEDGELEVMSYKVGGKKSEMLPYAGAVLSDKLHLDDEDLVYNRLLNEQRKQAGRLNYDKLMAGGDTRYFGVGLATEGIQEGNMTKEQYVKSAMSTRGDTKADFWSAFQNGRTTYANDNQVTFPDFQPQRFTKSQQRERTALSERAARTLFSNLYDIAYTQNLGREETIRGAIPRDPGNGNRDLYKILLQFGTDQTTVDRNRAWLKQLSDSQDPKKSPAEQLRLRHDLINRRMKEILTVDYSQFANLDDAHFVDKWPEFQRAFESVSVIRAAIGDEIRKKDSTIDRAGYEACRKIEDKFGGLYFESVKRISMIANPYYATVDPNQILDMSPQERNAITSVPAVGSAAKRFCADLVSYSSMKNEREATDIKADLEERGLIDTTAQLQFNRADAQVSPVESSQLNLGKGPYIVSVKGDPDTVFLYQKDPQTGKFTEAPSEARDRHAYALWQVQRAGWEKSNPVGKKFAEAMVIAPDAGMNSTYITALNEILDNPENDYDALVARIKERAHRQPRMSQEEFCKRLPDAGEKLSPEEIEKRRNLSHAAQDALIDDLAATIKVHAQLDHYDEKMNKKDLRAIKHFLLKNSMDSKTLAANESILNRIYGDNSTSQSRKEAVEEVLKGYLAQRELMERTYTDEELVQNWGRINGAMNAMGMEYENFWKDVVEPNHIDVSPKLVKESREMFQRVAVTSSYYQQRMKVIANRYFQYGQEEAVEKNTVNMQDSDDPEWGTLGRTCSTFYSAAESAEWVLTALDVGLSEKTLDYAMNMAGEQFQPWVQNKELTAALRSGQPMLLFGKDGGVPRACRQVSVGVPPKTETIDYLKIYFDRSNTDLQQQTEAHKLYQLSYDARQEHIEKSRMSPMEKKLKLNELEAHYKLDQVLYNPTAPNYGQALEAAMVELAANIMINKAVLGKGYKEDLLQELGLDKTRTDMVNEMTKTGLGKYLVDTLPKEPYEIAALSGEQMFEKIAQATKTLQAEKARTEELHTVEIPAASDVVSKSFSQARKLVTAALPPKLLGFKDDEIAGGIVQKNGVELDLNRVKILTAASLFNSDEKIDRVLNESSDVMCGPHRLDAETYLSDSGHNGDIHFTLVNGMESLSAQIFQKMDNLQDFSITELSKPENRNLLQAAALLTEMRKALERHDKENPREFSEFSKKDTQQQLDREASISGVLGTIMSGVPEGIVTSGNFDTYVKNYLASNLLSESLRQMKEQNGGKSMEELLNISNVKATATTIQKEVLEKTSAELGLNQIKRDPAKMQEMLHKIQNDQAAKEMGVKLTSGGKLSVHMDKLFKPAAKPVPEKKIDPVKGALH